MPQLGYFQNAIIAQPGMLMDGPDQAYDKVSRICTEVIPFGSLCEMDANGNYHPHRASAKPRCAQSELIELLKP